MKSRCLQLAILMLATALAPGHASAQEVGIRAAQVSADAGEDIVIPVSFQSGEPVVAAQFDLSFDVLALQPTLTTGGNSLTNHDLDFEEVAPGLLRVVITTASLSVLQDGELAAIGFKVSLDALPGEYPLVLGNLVLADGEGDEVTADVVEDGLVTIYNESLTGIPTLSWPGYVLLVVLMLGLGWVFLRQGAGGVAFSFLIGCVLFTSVLRAVTPPGDANDDGNVNTDDIPVIVAEILEREAAPGDPDCNEDEAVDVRDTVCAALADEEANRPPVLDPIANQLAQEDELLEVTATADDPDLPGDTLEFSLDTAPAGMSVDSTSGLISWTPAGNQVGSHTVTVRVTDEGGLFDTGSFQVTVENAPNRPPELSPINDAVVDDGVLFQVTAVATDPDLPDDALVFSLDTAPAGMSINPTSGLISWTPAVEQIGSNPVTVRVTDQENLFDTTSFTITVTDSTVNSAPTLQAPGNRVIRANSPFNANLFATDPDLGDTLTFSLPSGPVDLAVDPVSGELEWTPGSSDLGSHPVTARVTDAGGLFDEKSFSIEVTQQTIQEVTNQPPQLTVPPSQEIVFGNALNVSASATDPDAGDSLVFSLTSAPSGLGINSSSGAISWTPIEAQVGAHDVTVKVTDSAGAMALGSFVITVLDINRAPVAVDEVYEARLGETLVIAAPGVLENDSDPDGDSLTAGLVTDVDKGDLAMQPDGSFTYLLEPTPPNTEVELELWCSNSLGDGDPYQTNGTPAVGDVDNDGDIEIVGIGWTSGRSFLAEVWIMNAEDCSQQFSTGSVVEDAGGFEDDSHIGLLDIDNDGDLEIIAPRGRYPFNEGGDFDGKHLMALHHDGSFAWGGNHGSETSTLFTGGGNYWEGGPTFADIDADGTPEIIMAFTNGINFNVYSGLVVYNAEDGTIQWEFLSTFRQGDGAGQKMPYVVDLDLDGTMEVIVHNSVVSHEGVLEFELPSDPAVGTATPGHLYLGIANFDDDPYPELIGRDYRKHYLFEHDGSVKWEQELPKVAHTQINVADFDGDGEVEFSYITCTDNLAFGNCSWQGLAVYDTDGSLLWKHENDPDLRIDRFYSGRVNATAFDANRDGAFDLVFRNETPSNRKLYIIDGRDGSVLESVTAWGYTGVQRYPVIADINGDGHAEIINSYTGGIQGQTEIWTGTAENPLPKAPPIRNQWNFSEAYVNEDFTIPTNPVPHWLQPGGNGYHLIRQQPDPLVGTTASFQYAANDGELDSNTATVTLDILPAGNPPVFLTEPDTLTTRGFPYAYEPIVVDPDLGDTVTFSLMAAPTGMSMDPATGALSWLPNVVGEFNVSILALDTIGYATDQTFVLEVGEPVEVPDVVGQPEATAETNLNAENLLVGKIRRVTDPTVPAGSVISQQPPAGSVTEFGGKVDLWISLGPAPEDIDDDSDGFPETGGDCDDTDDSIYPGASDTAGDGIDQDCDGLDGSLPVSGVRVEPATLTLLAGESTQLSAWALFDDNSAQNITSIANWNSDNTGIATVTGNGKLAAVAPGSTEVTASRDGQSGSTQVEILPFNAGDDLPPEAAITTPSEGDSRFQSFEVIGTASDSNLVRYELAIAPVDTGDFTLLHTGTNPVSDGVLGEIDPTTLLNDLYTLRLTVLDAGGNQTFDEITLQLEGRQKLGHFTLEFTDLTVPLGVLPIDVVRTYDSRDKRKGDFGVGWRLDVASVNLSCTSPLGAGWFVQKSGLSWVLGRDGAKRCTLNLADGRTEVFDLVPTPSVSPIVPFSFLTAKFQPRPGTLGTLNALDNNNLLISDPQPGEVRLLDDTTLSQFEPDRFIYTALDGSEYVISTVTGVESVTDRNGNVITVTPGGISHSSGPGVSFTRDAAGRISQITDPAGNTQSYTYSADGDLILHTDSAGAETRYRYDFNHRIIEVLDPLNRPMVRNEYDAEGRLIQSTTDSGRTVQHTYDVTGRVRTTTDSDGGVEIVEYDERGNITRKVDALGGETLETYDAQNNPLTTTDPLGRTTTRTFDANGNVLTETNPLGQTTTRTYNQFGQMLTQTDPLGRTTTMSYDARGNLLSTTTPDGAETRSVYDAKGQEIASIDPLGNTTQYERNAAGLVTAVVRPDGSRQETAFDANGNPVLETDPRGFETTNTFDPRGFVSATENALGGTTDFDLDPRGEVTAVTNELGIAVNWVLDPAGRGASQVTDALGNSTSFDYDPKGNLTEVLDALGRATALQYDLLGRRIREIQPDASVLETHYDAAGQVVRIVEPGGRETEFEYNAAGKATRAEDALGNQTQFAYDAAGRVSSVTDPLGRTTSYTYDAGDRPTVINYPDGSSVSVVYDLAGNMLSRTNELGQTWTYEYDLNNRLVLITDPLGGETAHSYDEAGNHIATTDAAGETTYYEYDGLNRLIRTIRPDGSFEQTGYDAAGNVVTFTDAKGQTTTLAYDTQGRLVSNSDADGEVTTFSYNALGELTGIADSNLSWTISYDSDGQPLTVTPSTGASLTYTWNQNGDVTSLTIHNGVDSTTTSYEYDALGRLESVLDGVGGGFTFEYDAAGRRTRLISSNGTETLYGYDQRDRLISLEHRFGGVPFERYDYTLNAAGDKERVDLLDGSSAEYTYDSLRRLVQEVQRDASSAVIYDVTDSYDEVGNRISRFDALAATTTTYSYGAGHQMLTAGPESFTYDANGSLIAQAGPGGIRTFSWDAENRLTQANLPGGETWTFSYDAFGNRRSESDGTTTTDFTVDLFNRTEYSQVVAEHDRDTAVEVARYVFGDDLLAQFRSGSRSDYHVDGQGNVRLLSDASGNVVNEYRFAAFGELLDAIDGVDNVHLFQGERRNRETGLDYMRARVYAPELGRFLSVDPFAGLMDEPASLHKYQFAYNNPLVFSDPSGNLPTLKSVVATLGVLGSISALFDVISIGALLFGYEKVSVVTGNIALVTGLAALAAPKIAAKQVAKEATEKFLANRAKKKAAEEAVARATIKVLESKVKVVVTKQTATSSVRAAVRYVDDFAAEVVYVASQGKGLLKPTSAELQAAAQEVARRAFGQMPVNNLKDAYVMMRVGGERLAGQSGQIARYLSSEMATILSYAERGIRL